MKEIRKTFFGKYDIPENLVLTPIGSIYDSITLGDEKRYKGWWNSKEGYVNDKRCFVSKIPQRGTIDAVLSLNDSRIVLIGYCGSIGNLPIGETVCSSVCLKEDETEFPGLDWEPFMPVITCHSDAFLLEDEKFLESVRLRGAKAIDMETFDFYKHCRSSGNMGLSIMIVTDIPGKSPFYRIDGESRMAIKSGIARVSEKLREFP